MTNGRRPDYTYEAHNIATSLRLAYIDSYIIRGMHDMAAEQLHLIGPEDQQLPSVLAAWEKLRGAQGEQS